MPNRMIVAGGSALINVDQATPYCGSTMAETQGPIAALLGAGETGPM